jgi:predicted HicB family RNase H-like nuclease
LQSTNWKGCAMSVDHYTYRVTWSAEDGEHVGLCAEFPSLSWLAATPEAALKGVSASSSLTCLPTCKPGGEDPCPCRSPNEHYSGEFRVRIPPEQHRRFGNRGRRAGCQPEPAGERKTGGLKRYPAITDCRICGQVYRNSYEDKGAWPLFTSV